MTKTLRLPPHNLGAEESVLGAMLLSRDAIAAAVELVRHDDFYKPAHAHIFDAVTTLYGAGEPADPITVAEELRRAGIIESIGGSQILVDLQAATPSISNVTRYAKIVAENALLRKMIGVAGEIAEMGYELPDDVPAAVDRAEHMMFSLAQRHTTDTMAPVRSSLGAALETILDPTIRPARASTGFWALDDLLMGLAPGAMYVVGARPSMGKTAFALSIARHIAKVDHLPVLFASLEMGNQELTTRLLSMEAQVESQKLKRGAPSMNDDDMAKLMKAVGSLETMPLFLDDDPSITVMQLRGRARRLEARHGKVGAIIVDYLQLMTGRTNAESRQVEVAEMSRNLKILARELQVPVIALSQLSRQLENRADKRPMLSDLRESGSLEQDADVVMFIYRDEVYNPASPDKGIAEVIVAKHRNGATGIKRLAFIGPYTKFANLARATHTAAA